MLLYPSVETAKVLEFLDTKGFVRTPGGPFSFSNPGDTSSPIVSVDEEAAITDLKHLADDWTVQGGAELAFELTEFGAAGRAIYNRKIRPLVEPDETQKGRIVAIDVKSGDYEIADGVAAACVALTERLPDAKIWVERVGFRTVGKMRTPRKLGIRSSE